MKETSRLSVRRPPLLTRRGKLASLGRVRAARMRMLVPQEPGRENTRTRFATPRRQRYIIRMSTLLISHPACLDHQTPPGHPDRPDRMRAVESHHAVEARQPDVAVAGLRHGVDGIVRQTLLVLPGADEKRRRRQIGNFLSLRRRKRKQGPDQQRSENTVAKSSGHAPMPSKAAVQLKVNVRNRPEPQDFEGMFMLFLHVDQHFIMKVEMPA